MSQTIEERGGKSDREESESCLECVRASECAVARSGRAEVVDMGSLYIVAFTSLFPSFKVNTR